MTTSMNETVSELQKMTGMLIEIAQLQQKDSAFLREKINTLEYRFDTVGHRLDAISIRVNEGFENAQTNFDEIKKMLTRLEGDVVD